jgi:hypothetical protein
MPWVGCGLSAETQYGKSGSSLLRAVLRYCRVSPAGQLGKFSTSVVRASWPRGMVPFCRFRSSSGLPWNTSGSRLARAA